MLRPNAVRNGLWDGEDCMLRTGCSSRPTGRYERARLAGFFVCLRSSLQAGCGRLWACVLCMLVTEGCMRACGVITSLSPHFSSKHVLAPEVWGIENSSRAREACLVVAARTGGRLISMKGEEGWEGKQGGGRGGIYGLAGSRLRLATVRAEREKFPGMHEEEVVWTCMPDPRMRYC
ncbi:hypothetical protein EJ05DRAFT_236634 [Pseudovirgaria hyperparasitica]|uniref:Uncharacterized protein n=1 Tax=Pseudovirgaria hyperparasitica TaxID=470096 RepID=A0A6A6VRW1_9PEZI|nr:uncharacterized protein EJ05DRAFT_236634 [Pseudovirgaria hyperparasitica]KAF2752895.1 hypothetical protein EJ05DRAFT_236634 [Pseudovirgaria hyperparasitica]